MQVAGTETTANTLSFAVYLLSRHPEAEAKLIEEVEGLDSRRVVVLVRPTAEVLQ
jgi:cytochrome P450